MDGQNLPELRWSLSCVYIKDENKDMHNDVVVLSQDNKELLWIPKGCTHAYSLNIERLKQQIPIDIPQKASDYNCCVCGKQAEYFFPVDDPFFPTNTYCSECLKEAQKMYHSYRNIVIL